MTKATKEKAQKAESNFGVHLIFIVSHFLKIGEQVAEKLTSEQINAIYKKQKREEAKAEREGKIYLLSPEFSRAILRGCEWLAHLPREEKLSIIKAYL